MLEDVRRIATNAGKEILQYYGSTLSVDYKGDDSPLTEGDRASHAYISTHLQALTPDIPVVSEESVAFDGVKRQRFWLVDPLDGTKEFIKRTGEFTVNIALIEDGYPVAGVIHVPVSGITYYAERQKGAYRSNGTSETRIRVRRADAEKLFVVASRDHAGPQVSGMLERMPGATCLSMGSSLKFCLIAEGQADIYLRDVPTMEWDTAAAQCIVEEAGGHVLDLEGNRLPYDKTAFKNPSILTIGDPSLTWRHYVA